MTSFDRSISSSLIGFAFSSFVLFYISSTALGQVIAPRAILNNAAQKKADEAENEDDEDEAPAKGANVIVMDRNRWEEMLFSQFGGTKASFEQNYRRQVRIVLNQVDKLCDLSDEVRRKVQASADMETQRLEATIDALLNDAPKRSTQQQYVNFYQKLIETINKFQANKPNIDSKSLWTKVLFAHLSEDQQELIREDRAKRVQFDQDVQRLETVASISRRLGLTAIQIAKLDQLSASQPKNWIDINVAWNSLRALPEEEKKSLLTPRQIQSIKDELETMEAIQLLMRG